MTFRVGQKVVCVRDDYRTDTIREGEIYTIRWIGKHCEMTNGKLTSWNDILDDPNSLVVRLVEVRDEAHYLDTDELISDDFGYDPDRFRPLVSKPTSIEWAHRIDRKVFGGVDA